jgi:hypothetical protein
MGKKCARESSRMASRSDPFLYSMLGLSPATTQTATPTRGVIIFMTFACPSGVGQGSMRLYLVRVRRGIILMSNSRQLQAMTPCAMTRRSSPVPWRPPYRSASPVGSGPDTTCAVLDQALALQEHSPTSQAPALPVFTGFPCTPPPSSRRIGGAIIPTPCQQDVDEP